MKAISLLFISIFISASSLSFPARHDTAKKYNASMSETSVQNLFDGLIDNQDDVFLNNYSTVYFSHLNETFPINSNGTCSATALSMLLSFYDSYWDDDFVDEDFEQTTTYVYLENLNYNIAEVPSYSTESPGIISEDWEDVENLSTSQYISYVLNNQNNYLQSYLIKLAYDLFGNYGFEDVSNPYGMTLYEQTLLTHYYLVFRRYISTNRAAVLSEDSNNADFYDDVVNWLNDGIPVVLNIHSSSIGNHTVVAYDYDDDQEEIYVHSGWKDNDGNALTHVSLSQLNVTTIDSALIIEATNSHNDTDNYRCGSNYKSSYSMIYPQMISCINGNYLDIAPTFKWESLYEEQWFNSHGYYYGLYIEFSLFDHAHNNLLTTNIYSGTEYTLSSLEWANVLNNDYFNYYFVQVELKSANNPYNILENRCIMRFAKPSAGHQKTILTTDYTGYDDYYETRFDVDKNFATHTTTEGFQFKTRRYRAGFIHNECVTISPKRATFKKAFIEYQFITPIDRIDIELSYWREAYFEGLDPDYDIALFQEYRYGEYNTLIDLLDPDTNLSEDRNDMSLFTLCFDRPISRLRLYAETYYQDYGNDNRGRISVGTIVIYENPFSNPQNDITTTGYERTYEPNLWNENGVANNYNCYGYALNYQGGEGVFIDPGLIGNHNGWYAHHMAGDYYTIDVIEDLVAADAAPGALSNYGFIFSLLQDKNEIINDVDAYKVALVFDLTPYNEDYHWYRQNPDGTWCHKPSSGDVRDYDFDGNPIYDPEFCNRKSHLNYNQEKLGNYNHDYYMGIYFFKVQGFHLGV